MVFSGVIINITISSSSCEFCQSYLQISATVSSINGLAVAALDLSDVDCSAPCLLLASILNIRQLSQSSDKFVSNTDVLALKDLQVG